MPYTSITAARDDILGVFKTAWDASAYSTTAVYYQDRKKDPTDDNWVGVTIQHNDNDPVSIGPVPHRFRQFGLLTFQLFTELGDGQTAADGMTDVLVNAYCGRNTGADKISFRNATPTEIGRSGKWFQTNVVIEFDYDREVG